MSATKARQNVLAARPHGKPRLTDCRLEETAIPTPGPGQVLLRVQYLSLNPSMRGRRDDRELYLRKSGVRHFYARSTAVTIRRPAGRKTIGYWLSTFADGSLESVFAPRASSRAANAEALFVASHGAWPRWVSAILLQLLAVRPRCHCNASERKMYVIQRYNGFCNANPMREHCDR
jgi:hypothetical protein